MNAKYWRNVHYETLSCSTECKVKTIYIYIYIKKATIAEYLYLIATLRYINEKAMQFENMRVNKYEIVFVR